MPVSAKNVLTRAQIILQDAGAVRWPLTELVDWLNDGLKEICMLKPNAMSSTAVLPLEVGTLQTIPEEYAILIRAWNNCDADGTPSGNAVTPIVREILDQHAGRELDVAKVADRLLRGEGLPGISGEDNHAHR